MQIIKTSSYRKLSKKANEIVVDAVFKNPNLVLGLATGSTPLGLYQLLIKSFKGGKIDFSKPLTTAPTQPLSSLPEMLSISSIRIILGVKNNDC